MTTTLIPSTSSAPTLRERAIAEAERKSAESERYATERHRATVQRSLEVLAIHLRDRLGINDAVCEEYFKDQGGYETVEYRATAEGITFLLDDKPFSAAVKVLVPCVRGCGEDLWIPVDSIEGLGLALLRTEHEHDFACLQQFDDYGEPTTDRDGNPLPERKPAAPTLSPEQNARASIAAIETAATWVADALNMVAQLEDERALIKPEAIRRIMESRGLAATPAEKIVESDPEYAAHRAKQRDAEVIKWSAVAQYEAAKLRAKLDVALATRGDE